MASKKELQELLVELNKELRHTNSVSSRDDRVLRHLEKQIGQMVVALSLIHISEPTRPY